MILDICDKYTQLWKWKKYSNAEYIVIWSQHSSCHGHFITYVACICSEVLVIVALLRLVIEDTFYR
jgi:hypothetical protein